MDRLAEFRTQTENLSFSEIVSWALSTFGAGRVALATSFSIEDQVLTHLLRTTDAQSRIFTLDTGRFFQKTYNVWQYTAERYGVIETYHPDASEIAELMNDGGPNLFYNSIEKRKKCCHIRKIRPLTMALSTVDAWICGLRRDQSVTRTEVHVVEWDAQFEIYKINPLAALSEEDVWDAIQADTIPFNRLYKEGFRSIGCEPCTRAVPDGGDVRAGRWWWEDSDHKECGLHKA